MISLKTTPSIFLLFITLYFTFAHAATFDITNNCPYTVWAAAVPGGGRQLNTSETWTIGVPSGTTLARVWARTNCQFDASGRGKCESGDCNGVLQCESYGAAPCTLAEYALNQNNNMDFFDISIVDGFNVPMSFRPSAGVSTCSANASCSADINRLCPTELRDPGGCLNPCTLFKNDQFCCTSGRTNCGPTIYSKMFKGWCPDVYTYIYDDDATATFTCPSGTNYDVAFCP